MTTKELTKIQHMERQLHAMQRELTMMKMRNIARKQTVIERTGGALKGVIKGDPAKWQKKVRSEWDHRA